MSANTISVLSLAVPPCARALPLLHELPPGDTVSDEKTRTVGGEHDRTAKQSIRSPWGMKMRLIVEVARSPVGGVCRNRES